MTRATTLLGLLMLGAAIAVCNDKITIAYGQVEGSGWTERSYLEALQPEANQHLRELEPPPRTFNGPSSTYNRDEENGQIVETFRLLNRNSNRMEIRFRNEYTSGMHQFQGEVLLAEPIHDECVFQIFGNTRHATLFMLRAFSDNGGTLRHYDQQVLATGVFGRWVTVNVVHNKGHSVSAYIDGKLMGTWPDTVPQNKQNYFKYGVYGSLRTSSIEVQWRNVKSFTK